MNKHVLIFCLLSIAAPALAQSSASSSSSSTPAPASASSGTYSIEAEILAYKSLQVNSEAIATDVAKGLSSDTVKAHLLIVPSASTVLLAFQQWRANMAIVANYRAQYTQDKFDAKDACPVDQEHSHAPSFSAYTTAIGEDVAALQGILGLFANSQAVTEYPGTIQDQALITAVSRQLKTKGYLILVPDVYTSWAVANADTTKFPFLGQLADLITKHGTLQQIYQCNTLVVSAGTQLQQAEITRETDYTMLAAMDLNKPDAKPVPLRNDIASMRAQIAVLRGKIGIPDELVGGITTAEGEITKAGQTINDKTATDDAKRAALKAILDADASAAQIENQTLLKSSLKAAQAQGLVAGIESYLAGLTGGAVSLSSPAVAAAPVTATASSPAAGGATAAATGTSTTGGSSTPSTSASTPSTPAAPAPTTPSTSAAASATPPILTSLQMDGLALRMGLPADAADCSAIATPAADTAASDTTPKPADPKKPADSKPADPAETGHCSDHWRILWLKAMESGGADINEASIWGSHPYFGGGAVSGYALFGMDGSLNCSGNVAAYGGYVKAKDFAKHGALNGGTLPTTMLTIDGGCAATAGAADQH